MMKAIRVIAPALLGLLLASCGTNGGDEISSYSARQMAGVIVSLQEELPPLDVMTSDEDYFERHLENIYLLDHEVLTDGAIYYSEGTRASEIAVFEVTDETAPEQVADELEEYIDRRAADFTGYFPEEERLVENSVVSVNGDYVALLICEDPAEAESAFLACFGDEPPALPVMTEPTAPAMAPRSTSPPTEPETAPAGEYDAEAILAAWESGDKDSLTEKNRAVLELAEKVIGENITEGMADHEKELAIHDWIIGHVTYEPAMISNAPDVAPTPDNDNPYGALISGVAQCEGYTLSFQLFMDMLGIECVTVYGTNLWGREEHTWNVVRLSDGEWYCVDVTWDDTADVTDRENAGVGHKYFNVTSDFMYYNDHQWDRDSAPEATSTKYE